MNQLNYPEQHGAWLAEMGVTRWQATRAMPPLETHEQSAPTMTEVTNNIVPITQASSDASYDWPASVSTARYWVVSSSALKPSDAYLLAGMMQAIGAQTDEVLYSCITTEQEVLQQQATGLPTWPSLRIQTISTHALDAELLLPESVQFMVLGTLAHQWQIPFESLPSLAEMQEQPLRKREAWQVLKKYL